MASSEFISPVFDFLIDTTSENSSIEFEMRFQVLDNWLQFCPLMWCGIYSLRQNGIQFFLIRNSMEIECNDRISWCYFGDICGNFWVEKVAQLDITANDFRRYDKYVTLPFRNIFLIPLTSRCCTKFYWFLEVS